MALGGSFPNRGRADIVLSNSCEAKAANGIGFRNWSGIVGARLVGARWNNLWIRRFLTRLSSHRLRWALIRLCSWGPQKACGARRARRMDRSEEHTSDTSH